MVMTVVPIQLKNLPIHQKVIVANMITTLSQLKPKKFTNQRKTKKNVGVALAVVIVVDIHVLLIIVMSISIQIVQDQDLIHDVRINGQNIHDPRLMIELVNQVEVLAIHIQKIKAIAEAIATEVANVHDLDLVHTIDRVIDIAKAITCNISSSFFFPLANLSLN